MPRSCCKCCKYVMDGIGFEGVRLWSLDEIMKIYSSSLIMEIYFTSLKVALVISIRAQVKPSAMPYARARVRCVHGHVSVKNRSMHPRSKIDTTDMENFARQLIFHPSPSSTSSTADKTKCQSRVARHIGRQRTSDKTRTSGVGTEVRIQVNIYLQIGKRPLDFPP